MRLLLTLDYELFLGHRSGSVDWCLLEPTRRCLDAVRGNGVRFTVFVDAAYLWALQRYSDEYACLADDYSKIKNQLRSMHEDGHDIQLHIHPQWYFSTFDGLQWHIDAEHYKLTDIEPVEMRRLFEESKTILDGIIGKKTVAFRAGGFSAQPTSMLADLFERNGLTVDASVCPGEFYDSKFQQYDYRRVAETGLYHFDADICQPVADGRFLEVPFSMVRKSPAFQWRLLFVRLLTKFVKSGRHSNYGDGLSVATSKAAIIHRLTHYCSNIATIDGYKIVYLKKAIKECARRGDASMCILGHPKLATPFSVAKLPEVCAYASKMGHEFCTLTDLIEKQ